MAKRPSKQELKTPDAFMQTGGRVVELLQKNWPMVLAVTISIVIVGGGYAAYEKWNRHKEVTAQEALYVWLGKIETKQAEWSQALADEDSLKDEASKKDQVSASPKDFETDFGPLVKNLEEEIQKNRGTTAAQAATMQLADFLVEHDRLERATLVMRATESALEKSSWLFGLFKLQLASLMSRSGEMDEAIARLVEVTEMNSTQYLHPEALLKLAILYEEKGEHDKAKQLYMRVSTEYGDSESGRAARGYLRLIELKENLAKSPTDGGSTP